MPRVSGTQGFLAPAASPSGVQAVGEVTGSPPQASDSLSPQESLEGRHPKSHPASYTPLLIRLGHPGWLWASGDQVHFLPYRSCQSTRPVLVGVSCTLISSTGSYSYLVNTLLQVWDLQRGKYLQKRQREHKRASETLPVTSCPQAINQ